jgi:putative hydrolase of HD superfamily
MHDTISPVPFFHLVERLKTTKRTGWTNVGIEDGESISDHMYRMAILAMVAPTTIASRIDMSRCVQMALIHDMAESLVGDITPVEGVSKAEKSLRPWTTFRSGC